MARPFSKNPRKSLKLVAPVDEATKLLARELADKYFGGNVAESVRFAIRFLYETREAESLARKLI
jgi:hypothetical protein